MSEPAPAVPDDAYEGAGVVSSIHDMIDAAGEQDTAGLVSATAAAALDAVGFVDDPLDALATAGVGWLLEHVSVLRAPLDALCGDPGEIEDRAGAWDRLSRGLAAQAIVLDRAVAEAAAGWAGQAAAAYGAAAAREADGLRALSADARTVAELVLSSGVLVGTERSIIRDLIADFLVWLVPKAVAALGATAATAGTGGVVLFGLLLADVVDVARTLHRRVGELVTELDRMAELAGRLADRVADGTAARASAEPLAKGVLEYGKQDGAARAERAQWPAPAAGTPA